MIKNCSDLNIKNPEIKNIHNDRISESLDQHAARMKAQYVEATEIPTELMSWRMATMGRLSEMGIVNWEMTKKESKYSKGEYFDAARYQSEKISMLSMHTN